MKKKVIGIVFLTISTLFLIFSIVLMYNSSISENGAELFLYSVTAGFSVVFFIGFLIPGIILLSLKKRTKVKTTPVVPHVESTVLNKTNYIINYSINRGAIILGGEKEEALYPSYYDIKNKLGLVTYPQLGKKLIGTFKEDCLTIEAVVKKQTLKKRHGRSIFGGRNYSYVNVLNRTNGRIVSLNDEVIGTLSCTTNPYTSSKQERIRTYVYDCKDYDVHAHYKIEGSFFDEKEHLIEIQIFKAKQLCASSKKINNSSYDLSVLNQNELTVYLLLVIAVIDSEDTVYHSGNGYH